MVGAGSVCEEGLSESVEIMKRGGFSGWALFLYVLWIRSCTGDPIAPDEEEYLSRCIGQKGESPAS